MDFTDLHTFLLVARHGSFSAAAKSLAVPTSTVTRRLTRLEDALGSTLIHRTARGTTLTRQGEHLRARCEPAVRELEEAERSLFDLDAEPAGVLRLTAPADLGSTGLVIDLLAGFRARWPKIVLEIDLTERMVDLIAEGVDVALRPRRPGAQWSGEGLIVRTLAPMQGCLYASPAYLDEHGAPRTPRALGRHPWIAHRAWTRQQLVLTNVRTGAREPIAPAPAVLTNHLGQVLAFVLAGGGIGAVPEVTALRLVEQGALSRVLPGWSIVGGQLTLLWPESRHPSPRLRAFIDYTTEYFERHAELGPRGARRPPQRDARGTPLVGRLATRGGTTVDH
jgi:DNA-binding transcriptional LysR family regulator